MNRNGAQEQKTQLQNILSYKNKVIKRKKKVSCLRKERFGTTEKLWFESLKLCLSFWNKQVAQSVHSMIKTHASIQ